jgi:hypothetical protein
MCRKGWISAAAGMTSWSQKGLSQQPAGVQILAVFYLFSCISAAVVIICLSKVK